MSLSKIPQLPHYAVLIEKQTTVYHEGDERSRTNPGHGYPAYSETISSIEYEAFTDKGAWERRIQDLMIRSKSFRAMQAAPVKVTLKTHVSVSEFPAPSDAPRQDGEPEVDA